MSLSIMYIYYYYGGVVLIFSWTWNCRGEHNISFRQRRLPWNKISNRVMYSGYARILNTSYFILRFPGRVPPEWPNFVFSRKKLHHYGYRSISKFDHRRMVMMCGGGGSGWGKVAIQQQMGNLYLSSSFLIGRRRSIRSSWPILSIYSHSVGE